MSDKSSETRTRILKATWQLMEQAAGKGVRMSDIAAKAGVSRQAVYLHFASRAELLTSTTHYLDEVKGLARRLEPSRNAATGRERLSAFIRFWADYLPEIHGIATALIADMASDPAAASAWQDRLDALRSGCHGAIGDLHRDGDLADGWTVDTATDLLAAMLSVSNWEQLTQANGWSRDEYIERLERQATRSFVRVS